MNVKGSNEIYFNSLTVQQAVQEYLAKRWLVGCPVVTNLEHKKQSYGDQFIFTIEAAEPQAAKGDGK